MFYYVIMFMQDTANNIYIIILETLILKWATAVLVADDYNQNCLNWKSGINVLLVIKKSIWINILNDQCYKYLQ